MLDGQGQVWPLMLGVHAAAHCCCTGMLVAWDRTVYVT
jgi:hypothetical protein